MGNSHDQINEKGDHRIHCLSQHGRSGSQNQRNDRAGRCRQNSKQNADGKSAQGAREHIPPHPIRSKKAV